MNARERQQFVLDLVRSVGDQAAAAALNMPEAWDGEELRRYLADRFEAQCNLLARGRVRSTGSSKRLAAYNAAVARLGL